MLSTTYNEEFTWPEATGWGRKIWLKDRNLEENKVNSSKPIYRNYETLSQTTKECLTPFDYLLTPKPILQTHPNSSFSMEELPEDDGSARVTRPRVFKAPEISLDDIEDADIRERIIDFTYSTTSGLAGRGVAEHMTRRQIPNCTWEPPYHVLFDRNDPPNASCEEVSDEQLNEWDKKQSRDVGDLTQAFWERYRTQESPKVELPDLTDKIMQLAKEEKLRFPYTLRPPNYKGFVPENPTTMDPVKGKRDVTDTMITVYQLANRWADKD